MSSMGSAHMPEPDQTAAEALERRRAAVAELRAGLEAGADTGTLVEKLGDLAEVDTGEPGDDAERQEPVQLTPELLLRVLPVDDRRRWREHLDEVLNSMAGMRSELPPSMRSLADSLERTRSKIHEAESDPQTTSGEELTRGARHQGKGDEA